MSKFEWRKSVINRIRTLAKDIYENPESFVPEKSLMTDFTITLNVVQGGQLSEAPSIEVYGRYYPETLKSKTEKQFPIYKDILECHERRNKNE